VVKIYNDMVKHANRILNQTSIAVFNNKVTINLDDMRIIGNQIVFSTTGTHPRVNFAACWNSDNLPSEYLSRTPTQIKSFCVPSIHFNITDEGIHCIIDMFDNGFTVKDQIIQMPQLGGQVCSHSYNYDYTCECDCQHDSNFNYTRLESSPESVIRNIHLSSEALKATQLPPEVCLLDED